MSAQRITLCVLSAPDEAGLADCLASAAGAVDETLVGLTGSAAAARALARRLGVRVVPVPWEGDYAAARSALLKGVCTGWAFMLDADERLVLPEPGHLRTLVEPGEARGYLVPIESSTGDWLEHDTLITYQPRLFHTEARPGYTGRLGERLHLEGRAPGLAENVRIAHGGFGEDAAAWRAERHLNAVPVPTDPDPLHSLCRGMQLLRLGQEEEALTEFARGDGPMHARWRAHALLRLGLHAEALALLEAGCRAYPAYTDLWLLRARALAAAGREAEAALACRRCLDLGTPPPPLDTVRGVADYYPHLMLAHFAEGGGRLDEALHEYAQAYRLRPDDPEPLYKLPGLLRTLDRVKEAPAMLKELVRPVAGEHWLQVADVLSVHRLYGAALLCVRTALRKGADPDEAGLMHGFCLLRTGRPLEAEVILARLDQSDPYVREMRLIGAWCRHDCLLSRNLVEDDSPESVTAAVHRAMCRTDEPLPVATGWGRAEGEFLVQTVDALLAARRKADAARVAALMECTGWPGGYRALGMLLQLRGQRALAKRYLGLALEHGQAAGRS